MENRLTINGDSIYYELKVSNENNPTIVFLHDSLGCVTLWRDFPQKIADATGCNILVYDRVGYGKSDPMSTDERLINYLELEADFLNLVLERLQIENPILFGHSDGATIALLAASKFPDKIKAIVVEAAHIFVDEMTLNGIATAKEAYAVTNLPERLAKYHGDKVNVIFNAWVDTWTRVDYRNWNIEHFLPGIICPLLFIQGDADEYGTMDQLEKTISQVSGMAEKYIVPNIGHTPHKEAPELTLNVTEKFINKVLKQLEIMNNTEEILIQHLTAFGNNDLDAIVSDYTEESLIFTSKGIIRGLKNIRQFFTEFFEVIPKGSEFGMVQKIVEDYVAYIVWNSDSKIAKIPLGTDSFVFEDGKIKYHMVADYRIGK